MLFSIFFYMFPSLVDNRANMIICQRIENRFSLSAALYQFILFQNTEADEKSQTESYSML